MFNVPPRAKVIWRRGHRLVKPGIEPATPGLQGERFIHYTTAAPVTYNIRSKQPLVKLSALDKIIRQKYGVFLFLKKQLL